MDLSDKYGSNLDKVEIYITQKEKGNLRMYTQKLWKFRNEAVLKIILN